MNAAIPLQEAHTLDRQQLGGKGFYLSRLVEKGLRVPFALCVPSHIYREFIKVTGLRTGISQELNRKSLDEMRWEEVWDTALRIRTRFSRAALPAPLHASLKASLERHFSGKAVAVRSSAPAEDAAGSSFAGLHASYLNVLGTAAIIHHIQLVWASLWSDAALLYRRELGLAVEESSMAVVVQELITGERSGVAFGRSPNDESQSVIEVVYGLNQGLVDGTVEPDRWILERATGRVVSHSAAQREARVVPASHGVITEPLPGDLQKKPPLNAEDLRQVFELALRTEEMFGAPQDVEWTWRGGELYLLQCRPITTLSSGNEQDKRIWYLGLRKSFDFLKVLREKVENHRIPNMERVAIELARTNVSALSDADLVRENEHRSALYRKWHDIYWKEFIPLAHGMRLFGMTYNDRMQPGDPYEFMELLTQGKMESLERNRMLEGMAEGIRKDPELKARLEEGGDGDIVIGPALDEFMVRYGDIFSGAGPNLATRQAVAGIILEMASRPPASEETPGGDISRLKEAFLSSFPPEEKGYARELLELGRSSYRLRDDDNIYMGKIKGQWLRTEEEVGRRFSGKSKSKRGVTVSAELFDALKDPTRRKEGFAEIEKESKGFKMKARQIVGQPAGPGISEGKARVILNASDLFAMKAGEILVCDAVDPNMTFIVPLSAGIVERRGGMLIHGAIIAREYGLPCVTGVTNATALIRTGDKVTVDGYLGIVVVG
jgi:pyruvate,water dikinase